MPSSCGLLEADESKPFRGWYSHKQEESGFLLHHTYLSITKAQLSDKIDSRDHMTFIYSFSVPCAIFLDKMKVLELYFLRKARERNLICSEPWQAESRSLAGALPMVTVSTRRMRSTCGGVGLHHRKGMEVLTEQNVILAGPEPSSVSGTLEEFKKWSLLPHENKVSTLRGWLSAIHSHSVGNTHCPALHNHSLCRILEGWKVWCLILLVNATGSRVTSETTGHVWRFSRLG